ncbi:NAD-dependent epimerase/dehydratase family protein [Streptomyces kronopolitis]
MALLVRILITGHMGFVGGHFRRKLWEGNDLTLVDKRDGVSAQVFFNDLRLHENRRYDLVIHLAAMVGGRAKIDGDPLAIAENLAIDSDMFRWAIRTSQPRIVYYSSSAAYPIALQGRGRQRKLREDDIWFDETAGIPDQTYGWAKLTGERLAEHAEAAGTRVHIFRPFSGYGEDQDLDYPFPSFIDRVKRRANPFEIWGDGRQTRDFIHIDDVVDATLEAVAQGVEGPINLGLGRPTSFLELAELVTAEAGYSPEFRLLPDKPVGCFYRVADATKMNSFYAPRVTLEQGIQRAMQ